MKYTIFSIFISLAFVFPYEESDFVSYEINPSKTTISMYWKDGKGDHFGSIKNLKTDLEKNNKKLLFAMNGGMYMKDRTPLGLYVEKGVVKRRINKVKEAYGNFYIQPNGIFYLTKDNKADISTTDDFELSDNIGFATQSGPMLLVDGTINSKLTKGSSNLHIRNGVGVFPNGNVLFAISSKPVSFYDFATFFKEKGCKNALYLDGFVSRAYIPSKKREQLDGDFGVIIAVVN